MPEGDVVEAGEGGRVHVVRTAHGNVLRLRTLGPRDELVRDEHFSFRVRRSRVSEGYAHGVGIRFDAVVGIVSAHVGGLYERQHIERDLSPLVAKSHRVESARIDGRHIHALRRHESAAESDALGRIVIAADDENAAQRRERDEKVVEKLDGLGARHRLVVDVAGNDRGVRPLRLHYA